MTTIVAAGVAIPSDRVRAGRGRRAAARPDEDAVTLAVEASARALPPTAEPRALLLASTTLPYDEGGSVQVLAELLGLQGDLFTAELTAGERDGLAALRLGSALVAAGQGPVLVCASHVGDGAGAVALLLDGPAGDDPLAELDFVASYTAELRDRWRLRAAPTLHDGDRSFVADVGTVRLAELALAARPASDAVPTLVAGPDTRASATVERRLGGPGDALAGSVGRLGPAHALLRLVTGLDARARILAIANGCAECVDVVPTPAGTRFGQSVADVLATATDVEPTAPFVPQADFQPYASGPRSWRDRGLDLRLEGILPSGTRPPGRHPLEATVVTWERDHVYPANAVTDMAIVDIDGGGRFFGQVAAGETVAIGQRVRLVPRRLHAGGDVVQYFWKVTPCR